MVFADTILTVGNTMIVAGILLGIVLVVRAARRRPPRPTLQPGSGISGLERRRPPSISAASRGDAERTAVLHRDSARTSTWRGGDRWQGERAPWETGGDPPRGDPPTGE